MPVHQGDRLPGLSAFHMRDELIKIQDVLGAGLAEENTPRLAVLQIVQKTLAGQPDIFTGNNLPRHDALGVADTIGNLSH
ncbi:hypothetical protein CRSA5733_21690 [Cronobacter sakazakii]